jgi:hypothetical protein|tara:strand:- start:12490 stop:14823 length:2334 start_codon:yes stop_codon:yes gene_type:complete
MTKKILILSLLVLVSVLAFSQSTIKGFVYDKQSGEPVIFTNVFLHKTSYGAVTDVNGYYSISGLPEGEYSLMVTSLGYDSLKIKVNLNKDQIVSRKLFLAKGSVQLNEFEVFSERQEAKTEVKMSVVKITAKQINKLPTVGGESDLAQYLQVLPGVIFTGDQGGQLYIRGGSPVQNKVLMDGMIVYNPFHSIGLFSVFETDIIRNADVYTGGFNAEYGGRISSIMDITTRDGNSKHFGGKTSISPFGGKLILEGPIVKPKKQGDSYISYIISGKSSFLDKSSKLLYSYIDTAGLPFNFTDIYGKVSFSGDNGSKLNLFGFNYRDRVNYRNIADIEWENTGAGGNFVLVPLYSTVLVEGNFAYSKYDIIQSPPSDVDGVSSINERSSSINGFNLGLDFTYFILENEIKYGVEVVGLSTEFKFLNSLNREIEQSQNTNELSGYLKYKWSLGKLIVEPSFRGQFYAAYNTFSPEPRLGIKYNLADRIRLKVAGGLYSQNLISANSDRDVVNLFYGFLTGSDDLQNNFTEQDGSIRPVKHKLQKANHYIVGIEYDLTKKVSVNLEAYLKDFTQLTNLNRNKIFDDNEKFEDKPEIQRKDFIVETGKAKGIDLVVKYDYKRYYFWAVYSIGIIDRWDGLQSYNPVFDRRHNVNLVGSMTFGKNLNWELNGRWNFGSGFPFTQTQGFYELHTFSDGTGTDYTTDNGDLGIQYGALNAGRLPSYHRLDLNVKYKQLLTNDLELEANLGVTNAYNRQNIFYFDRITYDQVNQLPIMPSVGISLTF